MPDKFADGPWKLGGYEHVQFLGVQRFRNILDAHDYPIGMFYAGGEHAEEERANLQLAVAAPELLVALKALYSALLPPLAYQLADGLLIQEQFEEELAAARAAITKAEESNDNA